VARARWVESHSKCVISGERIVEEEIVACDIKSLVAKAKWAESFEYGSWAVKLLSKKSCDLTNGYNFWPSGKHLILTFYFFCFHLLLFNLFCSHLLFFHLFSLNSYWFLFFFTNFNFLHLFHHNYQVFSNTHQAFSLYLYTFSLSSWYELDTWVFFLK